MKLQLNALSFGTAIYDDGIFHLTCVMPIPGKMLQTSYILATNNTVKQTTNAEMYSCSINLAR